MELKIKIGDGLKQWKELHGKHLQKGPDVLIVSTQYKNLTFKTTFTPGPGTSQDLQCIIAGEIITFAGMDFTPEDWRALVAELVKRNDRNKEKSAEEKYIEKTLKAQRALSDKARLDYEKTGNTEIVIRYIKKSMSGAVILEPWINETIQQWIRNDRHDLLKAAFHRRRGERSDTRTRAIEAMIFFERIEKHRRAGKSLREALSNESIRTGDHVFSEQK